jgi:His Kinase A (phosphoacceptor) domain./Histidine kinase-, DNA gyrase B-, and HSP90-like ATPase./Response regulator receiver domain.
MKKILIVEDEQDIRESIQDLLLIKGFEAITASNGKDGLFLAVTKKPDLILSDIMMPEMNGLEFLDLVQKNTELAGIPFIFLTAKIEHTSLREGMSLGADDYLTKPVKNSDLLDAINRRLLKAENLRKSIEEDLKALVTQMSSTAQHEFNTPLNGILGFAEIIKRKPNIAPDDLFRFAEILETSGYRLKATLDNIIMYQTILNKGLKPRNEDIILNSGFIENITEKLQLKYNRKDDLHINISESVKVFGSSDFLKKILAEIIDNAFKFSTPGNPVIIRTENNNGKQSLCITDEGRGLAPEQISSIGAFVQFERKKYEQQGLGLGLFISRELAKSCNWQVTLSPVAKGGINAVLSFR